MSLGIAQDTPRACVTLARTGSAADILVTIGGASVGEHDLVSAALRAEGMELDFWKIAMRPGKPLLYGRLGNQRVLGAARQPGVGADLRARVPGADAAPPARAARGRASGLTRRS